MLLIDTLLVGKVLKLEMKPVNYPEIYPIYETAMVVLWVATVVLVTGYHLYKLWREWHPRCSPVGAGAHCGGVRARPGEGHLRKDDPDKVASIVSEHLVNGRVVTEYTIGAAE